MLFRKAHESTLERLEREANDDFRLLAELGPEDFGVEHLVELRDRMQWRLAQFDRWRRFNLLIGATAGGWMLLGGFSVWAGEGLLARIAFGIMLLSVLGFITGAWMLKIKFESRGDLEYTLRTIEEELRRRATKLGRSAHL